jgi:hypothetical protein
MRSWHGNLSPFGTWHTVRTSAAAFNPVTLFGVSDTGWVYDLSDMSTLFQDAAGTTPVTAVGQPVGLELDKSKDAVGTNGAFRYNLLTRTEEFENAAWAKNSANAVANSTNDPTGAATGDTLRLNAGTALNVPANGLFTNATPYVSQPSGAALTAGSHSYSAYVKGGAGLTHVQLRVGASAPLNPSIASVIVRLSDGAIVTGSGTVSDAGNGWWRISLPFTATAAVHHCGVWFWNASSIASAAGTEGIYIWGAQLELGSTATAYQKITADWPSTMAGNHRTQSTALNRPTYARHPLGGIRNLLTRTEEFNDAAWVKTGAPTTTAGKIILDTGTSSHRVAQSSLFAAGLQTVEVEAAASELSFLRIRISAEGADTGARPANTFAFFNLGAGTVGTVGAAVTSNGGTATITDVGGGYYRCRLTFLCTVAGTISVQLYPKDADTANDFDNWTPASVGGIFARRAAAVQSATPIPYQRVGSTFDVTEAGVEDLYYLSYDGINDSLATASFAWGTDKATVVAGVRKLSDAAQSIVVETSPTLANNAGSFNLQAPSQSGTYFRFASKGTNQSLVDTTSTSFVAPLTAVLTGIGDISGDLGTLRVNGTQAAQSTADQGNGNYGSYPAYFSARAGTSLFFNGREYSNVGINRLLTTDELAALESWTAGKNGVTL